MTVGFDPDIVPYDTNDVTPNGRLLVSEDDKWVRVPLINDAIETHIRKGTDVNLSRVTEAYVPREWQGNDIIQYIDAFDPDARSVYDRAQAQYYDSVRDEYVTVHDGFIRDVGGVGSSEQSDSEPSDIATKLRILGPEEFLGVIPASETYRDPPTGEVMNYVRDTLVDSQPLYEEIPILARGTELDTTQPETQSVGGERYGRISRSYVSNLSGIGSPKTFTRNRHTLVDVIGWLTKSTGARVYFITQDDGSLALVYDETPTVESFAATNVDDADGNVEVRNNNALYQIGPRNALIYKGRTRNSIGPQIGGFQLTMPADKYPSVEVYHEPTVDRTGERFYGALVEGQKINLDEAESAARSRLKEIMDGDAGGKIECEVTPLLRPFSTLEATPACNGKTTTDVSSYTYEIEEVTHKVTATNGSRTDLRVSAQVAMDEIVVDKQSEDYGMKQK